MFKPIDISEIPNLTAREPHNGSIMKEIERFLGSSDLAAEVIVPHGRSANSVYQSYKQAIKAKSYPVNCIRRNGRIFLIAAKEKED